MNRLFEKNPMHKLCKYAEGGISRKVLGVLHYVNKFKKKSHFCQRAIESFIAYNQMDWLLASNRVLQNP